MQSPSPPSQPTSEDDWEALADSAPEEWTKRFGEDREAVAQVPNAPPPAAVPVDSWDAPVQNSASFLRETGLGHCPVTGRLHSNDNVAANPRRSKCTVCVDEVVAEAGLWFLCCTQVYCHRCFAHLTVFKDHAFKPSSDNPNKRPAHVLMLHKR
eukprot:GGOE01044309.1.p2 GENE.GGOE01044309.1~~GGOE01044309.1.p2  ORF type:complete len:154 (+),score=37.44 GGOE01044309.1:136-597(+)